MARYVEISQQVLDGDGNPIAGAKLVFREPGGGALKTVYSDSALTVPHTNPVIADGDGRYASIFTDGFYHVQQQDNTGTAGLPDGAVIWTKDNVSSGADDLENAINTTNIAALRLIDGNTEIKKAFVNGYYTAGDGGGGEFYWDATSTETDNGGTIIQATGIVTGRWKRLYSGTVNAEWFGSATSANLNKAIASIDSGTVKIHKGTTVLTESIVKPRGISLIGGGPSDILSISSSATLTADFAILLNSTDGSTWTSSFPNVPAGSVSGFTLKNDNHATVTCRGIFYAEPCDVHDIRFENMHQSIKSTNQYLDLFTARRIYCALTRGTDYQIDVQQLGDALSIDQIIFTDSTGPNSLGIRVVGSNGGQITNIIGGGHQIKNSNAIQLQSFHTETSTQQLIIDQSNVSINDMYLWASDVPRIKLLSTGTQRHTVNLSNVFTIINHDEMPTSYDQSDLQIHTNYMININNCGKLATKDGAIDVSDTMGLYVSDSSNASLDSWNDYSHFLSRRGTIMPLELPQLDHSITGGTGAYNPISASGTSAYVTWGLATNTYYYNVQLIADKSRLIGATNAGAEASIALTNSGNGALLTIGFGSRDTTGIIRIYRGTSPGSYDYYVDIPILCATRYYDDGTYINGFAWISRTAGAMDTMAFSTRQVEFIGPRANVWGPSAPASGAWVANDIVYDDTPSASGFIGWVCVTAGTPGTWKTFGAISA